MRGHLCAVRVRLAEHLSEREGDRLRAKANEFFEAQRVASPERYVAMFAPARAPLALKSP